MNYIQDIMNYKPVCEQEETDKKVILKLIKDFESIILTRKNEFAHITSTAFTINSNFDKLLMVHHNIYNSWSWIGGHADGDPNLLKVAEKEAREETGIKNIYPFKNDVFSLDILTTKGHKKNGKYVCPHLHLNISYLFVADENDEIKIKRDENSGVKWINIKEIDKSVNEKEMLEVYHKIIERLNYLN